MTTTAQRNALRQLAERTLKSSEECTDGPYFIWKEEAGYDEDELLGEFDHTVMAGVPRECEPSHVSGASVLFTISDDDGSYDGDPQRMLADARFVVSAMNSAAVLASAVLELLGDEE